MALRRVVKMVASTDEMTVDDSVESMAEMRELMGMKKVELMAA